MKMDQDTNGHGGAREGAGRPKGRPSLRRAAQAIAEVEEAYPGWSPILHLAAVANDESLPPEIRLDAAKAAAPYLHSRPKPVELDPDALVDLERRLLQARIEAAATTIAQPGLAERLQRAAARLQIVVDTGVMRAPDDLAVTPDATPPAAPQARPAASDNVAGPSSAPVREPPNADRPLLPRAVKPAVSGEWAAHVATWPNRNEGHAVVDYDPTGGAYDPPLITK